MGVPSICYIGCIEPLIILMMTAIYLPLWRGVNGFISLCQNTLFLEEMIETRRGTLIAALSEFDPENNQAGMGITSAHIKNQLPFIGSMLIGVIMRVSGMFSTSIFLVFKIFLLHYKPFHHL